MALQLKQCLFGLVTVVYFGVVAANVDCLLGLQTEATRCFSEAGIDLNDPKYAVSNNQNGMVFESIMAEKPDSFCEKKEQAKQAVACLMDHAIMCLPSQYRGLMPSNDAMGKAMDHLCSNRKDLNLDCVTNKYNELFQCGQEEGKKYVRERGRPNVQELLCMAYRVNPICQKRVLNSCGCKTSKVYTDISYDILYPKSCPPLNANRVVCSRSDANVFIDDGMGGGATGVNSFRMWNILIAFLFAFTLSRFH